MKKYILSAAIIALSTFAFAQTSEPTPPSEAPAETTETAAVQDSSSSTKIEMTALPEAVKTTLASDAYKAWTPTEAFIVKENGKEFYQINVMKEEEKGSVKINADGTPAS